MQIPQLHVELADGFTSLRLVALLVMPVHCLCGLLKGAKQWMDLCLQFSIDGKQHCSFLEQFAGKWRLWHGDYPFRGDLYPFIVHNA